MGETARSDELALVEGYYKLVVRELSKLGYHYDRNSRGSHERWRCAGKDEVIVPRNLYSRHTANVILKAAGSTRKL